MAIQRFPAKADDDEIRAFQERMTEVGRIRLGVFNPDKGSRGAPDKLDVFRLTSADERLIRLAAEVYGGEAREYTPQRGTTKGWEVITDVSQMGVYIPRQNIEPWNEAWRPGTCIRRCDGVTEKIKDEPCVCNGDRPPADRDLCKPTVRIQLMLPEVPGLGTWRLESHGANACEELSTPAPFIARTPLPVPAMLALVKRSRRPWNAQKGKFETLEFYVPELRISAATPAQFAIGGDALTQALIAGGAPVALAAPGARMAIGGSVADIPTTPDLDSPPVSEAPTASEHVSRPAAGTPSTPVPETPPVDTLPASGKSTPAAAPEAHPERAQILAAIESKTSMADMETLRDKLKARGVTDQAVRDSWQARYNALKLAAVQAPAPADPADHQASLKAAQQRTAAPEPEYAVGDTVTVGGIEFTKHSDDPFGPGGGDLPPVPEPEPEIVDGEVVGNDTWAAHEAAGAPDPEVAGEYDADEEFGLLYTAAGPLGWTTAQTNEKIRAFCGVAKVSLATGRGLHEMRMAIKRGDFTQMGGKE